MGVKLCTDHGFNTLLFPQRQASLDVLCHPERFYRDYLFVDRGGDIHYIVWLYVAPTLTIDALHKAHQEARQRWQKAAVEAYLKERGLPENFQFNEYTMMQELYFLNDAFPITAFVSSQVEFKGDAVWARLAGGLNSK